MRAWRIVFMKRRMVLLGGGWFHAADNVSKRRKMFPGSMSWKMVPFEAKNGSMRSRMVSSG